MSNDITALALIAKIKKQTESFDTVVLQEGEANALLDELEKAQRHANLTEAERQAYLGLISKRDELIAELDKRLIEYAGIATREARRVAELEARTVTPPKNNVANVGDSRWMWYQRDLMWIEAIRAAGIKVIEGEGQ